MSAGASFTFAGFRRGFLRSQAMALGIFAYGIAFGVVAAEAHLSMVQAMLMSGVIYSGSAQLAAVGVLKASGASILATFWTLVATILVMNARYMLYSATLRPWLSQVSPLKAYGTLFFLGDGSWLLAMQAHEKGERDAAFLLGSNLATFFPWLIGTLLGLLAVGILPEPRRLGFDFFLVAFAAAMMAGMIRVRADLVILAIAAIVAILVERLTNFGTALVAAGLAGGLVAWFRTPEGGRA